MQIVIEIPDEAVKTDNIANDFITYFECCTPKLFETLKNGTPLPKDATNGDIIKAMFPNAEVKEKTIRNTLTNQNILVGYEVFLYINKPRKDGEFGYGTE